MNVVGQIISGDQAKIVVRQKSNETLELGELLVSDNEKGYDIFQIFNLSYNSLVHEQILHSVSGMHLEGIADANFMEGNLKNYVVADVKPLLSLKEGVAKVSKKLPQFFSTLRRLEEKDLQFLKKPEHALFVGNVRSGSKVTKIPVYLNGKDVLSHHILVPATTGRGKSNLMKVMLWNILDSDYAGLLVLDPHNEYYDSHMEGLKYHPRKEKVISYTASKNAKPGQETLKINIQQVKPWHLSGIIEFTDAQTQAMYLYYKNSKTSWIENIIQGKDINKGVHETTLPALGRKLSYLFDIDERDGQIIYNSNIFSANSGENTINNILDSIENSKIVILDTSSLGSKIELLVGSVIVTQLLNRYKQYKSQDTLSQKPVASIVIEEAPRVLGQSVGSNVYNTIAKEGRKFNVGIIAITQLSSEIPRHLLANMNTKIILGNEMSSERAQIIASSAQDLSSDDRTIASLDKGEAVVSSIFTKFAIPIYTPVFSECCKPSENVKTAIL